MWSIRVLSGEQTGQIYDLKLGRNIFGRGGNSDLKILSLGISKEHCEIHVYKDKMMIVDLKSSNGTFVNGVKIQNSIIHVGDKVSLFDIIMDIIPTPDIRPKKTEADLQALMEAEQAKPKKKKKKRAMQAPVPLNYGQQVPQPYQMNNYPMQQGNMALQMNYQMQPMYQNNSAFAQQAQTAPAASVVNESLSDKMDNFMEEKVMPALYKLAVIFSFKQILQAFVLIFIFSVTILATVPLTNIIKESNLKEAQKRAKGVARSLAKQNEAALLAGQFSSLTVTEALKEEGIKDAIIVQQSDGLIVAPPEKAGRDEASTIVINARKEARSISMQVDSNHIGASFPIAVYDPATGEASPKYHAVVKYDISSLNFDEGRIVSLFMQTLIIASLLGMILYQLFARMIDYPLRNLNAQIDKALIDKTDRTEIAYDYPAFQKLVSNVNTILNRAWSGESGGATSKPQQNKDIEYSNLVEIISHPALVVDNSQRIVAVNSNFEMLMQISKDNFVNQSFQTLTDVALVQNIESLVVKCQLSPFEKHSDRIPFSQFECDIHAQAFLNENGEAQYFVLTLVQVT